MSNSTQASSTTAHYGLSQWAAEDLIRREDFNHDFAAIDAALHSQQQTSSAAIQSALSQLCVQKLGSQTLSADAGSITLDLSSFSLSQYARLELSFHNVSGTASAELLARFNNDAASGHYGYYQSPSINDNTGLRLGWVYSDYKSTGLMQLWDMSGKVAALYTSGRGDGQSNYSPGGQNSWCFWRQGGLSAVQSLKICTDSGNLKSGSSVTLYGWKK